MISLKIEQPMQWERDGKWTELVFPPFCLSLSSVLTWPGLWSHSSGSGWFLAGASPNINIPAEMAPAPSYQKTDRKYETRRKTPWQTDRQTETSIRIIWGCGAIRLIRWPRKYRQGVFSRLSWLALWNDLSWKMVIILVLNLPDVNLRKKIKIKFICHNNNWNIVIWPTFQSLRQRRNHWKYNFPISWSQQ